jgi:hypothetical protein
VAYRRSTNPRIAASDLSTELSSLRSDLSPMIHHQRIVRKDDVMLKNFSEMRTLRRSLTARDCPRFDLSDCLETDTWLAG